MKLERITHTVTLYHRRYNKRHKSLSLAICSCGWKDRSFRTPLRYKAMRALVCPIIGHKWGEEDEGGFGPIDYDADDSTKPDPEREWLVKHCERCLKVKMRDK